MRNLNTNITATIETPFGETDPIKIDSAVRQGTVWGPTMCAVVTDKINSINSRTYTMVGTDIEIETLVFVDNVLTMGTADSMERTEQNLIMLEQTKKFTFSVDKSELIHTKFMKEKKKEESTTITVKKGQIKRVSETKYLGEYFNDRGDNETRIQKKMNKVAHAIAVAKARASESKVGKEAMKVRLQTRGVTPICR